MNTINPIVLKKFIQRELSTTVPKKRLDRLCYPLALALNKALNGDFLELKPHLVEFSNDLPISRALLAKAIGNYLDSRDFIHEKKLRKNTSGIYGWLSKIGINYIKKLTS